MIPDATRWTAKSNVSGPGGDDTWRGFQVNVGCAVSMTMPAGLLSDFSVAQGGMTTGPIRPVVAVSPPGALASTRQNTLPGLSARGGTNASVVASVMTGLGVRLEALLRRRLIVTGVAYGVVRPLIL